MWPTSDTRRAGPRAGRGVGRRADWTDIHGPYLSHSRRDLGRECGGSLGDRASGSSFLWILQGRGPGRRILAQRRERSHWVGVQDSLVTREGRHSGSALSYGLDLQVDIGWGGHSREKLAEQRLRDEWHRESTSLFLLETLHQHHLAAWGDRQGGQDVGLKPGHLAGAHPCL